MLGTGMGVLLELQLSTGIKKTEISHAVTVSVLVPHSSRLQWRLSGVRKRLLTKLRVHHGLLVANMVEDHHEGVLHAACGR